MKATLLSKLRNIGRNQITVLSITRSDGIIIGMSYSFNEDEYRGLFSFGDTEAEVRRKACEIYLRDNIDRIRSQYGKYSRRNRKQL